MPGIEDLLMGPPSSNLEQIMRMISRYKMMDTAGDAALDWLKSDPEMEEMQRQQMRLSIAQQKRSLGFPYGDDGDYEEDVNDSGKDRATAAMGGEIARRARPANPVQALQAHTKNSLDPRYKIAEWMGPLGGDEMVSGLPKSGLHAIFKTAFSVENPLTKEVASHGLRNNILRAVARR